LLAAAKKESQKKNNGERREETFGFSHRNNKESEMIRTAVYTAGVNGSTNCCQQTVCYVN